MRFRKLDIEEALSRKDVIWGIMDILLILRRSTGDLDEIIESRTPTSRWWKNRWSPDAETIFARDNLEKRKAGRARMRECLKTFLEWAASSLNSAYDSDRAPEGAIRGILDAAIGMPVLFNKSLVCMGICIERQAVSQLRSARRNATSDLQTWRRMRAKVDAGKAQPKMETEGGFPLSTTSWWCKLTSTPKGIRGRSHLRCLVPGRLFTTDRESTTSNRVRSNHCDVDVPECYCDAVRGEGGRPRRHYRCSGFGDAFCWAYLL